ncbi:unnamed protein product [Knipowitschia caucasica]
MPGGKSRRSRAVGTTQRFDEMVGDNEENSPSHEEEDDEDDPVSLASILRELKDFRHKNKEQFSEIQRNQQQTDVRVTQAEARIDEVETALGATSTLIKQLLARQDTMEAKLTDQEARARRDNLRIYGIPEEAEGTNIIVFLENMLRDSLAFPPETDLKIERAHRALAPKPAGGQTRPRSIIAKFSSYRVKEVVIRIAWQKKQVMYKDTRFYVDHDYPPLILKKRTEYNQAKRVLKEHNIKFQTPYPAKMSVL